MVCNTLHLGKEGTIAQSVHSLQETAYPLKSPYNPKTVFNRMLVALWT